jgi:outer membrane protein OmpA-like peptidoglycan-associated protein/tetratricopeptide (TPR) repeat protein
VNVFFIVNATAQNIEFTKENFPKQSKQLKEALKNIHSGDKQYTKKKEDPLKYTQALNFYKKAYRFNVNNAELNLKMANCYYKQNNMDLAIRFGDNAYALNPHDTNKALFYRGYLQQQNAKYDEAIQAFTVFEANPALAREEAQAVRQKIKECETAKVLIKNEIPCFIDNLNGNINEAFDEYAPVLTNNDSVLYFTRKEYINEESDKERTYISHRDFSQKIGFGPASVFQEKLFKENEALQTMSKDGNYAIVYNTKNGGDLYEMTIKKGQWTKPKSIKVINSSGHETSASLNEKGDTLYFCSDRSDSYGEHDIYMSVRNKKGKWTKPQHLSDKINTPLDEISVFLDAEGNTLYFSSQGHQNMGGFDIFKSTREDGQWTKPENMGYPINSPCEDVYFSISKDKKTAYFSSNRKGEGEGKQDIYKITFLGAPKLFLFNTDKVYFSDHASLQPYNVESLELEKEKSTTIHGIVIDGKTKAPLYVIIELSDIGENQLLTTFTSDSVTGKYTLLLPAGRNYGINIKKEGYLYYSENFNVSDSSDVQSIDQVISLNKIEINQTIILKNIFFDVNKTTLKPESATEIENAYKLMIENPSIEIEISGHTDNVGTDAYNKKLSQGRAAAVVNALVEKGIAPSRMKSVGYGFDKPIAPNNTETGRMQNRRTEFKIIKK